MNLKYLLEYSPKNEELVPMLADSKPVQSVLRDCVSLSKFSLYENDNWDHFPFKSTWNQSSYKIWLKLGDG